MDWLGVFSWGGHNPLWVDILLTRLPEHVTMATTNPKLSAFIWSVADRILTMIGGLSHSIRCQSCGSQLYSNPASW